MSDNQSTDELYTFEEPPPAPPRTSLTPKLDAGRDAAKANPGKWVKITPIDKLFTRPLVSQGFDVEFRGTAMEPGDLYLRWPVS